MRAGRPAARSPAPPAAGAAAATAPRTVHDRGGTAARRPAAGRRGSPAAPARLGEPFLVAAAVLLGGPLDVGDPLAPLVGVGLEGRVALGDALGLDRERLVDEPLRLQLGLLGVAGVGPWFQMPMRIWKKPTESRSPKFRLATPLSTSEAITGSSGGRPAFCASRESQPRQRLLAGLVAGVRVVADGHAAAGSSGTAAPAAAPPAARRSGRPPAWR